MEPDQDSDWSDSDFDFIDPETEYSPDSTTGALIARLDEVTLDEADSTETDLSESSFSPRHYSKLHFHFKKGVLVNLGKGARMAERIRPLEEFNNAVVVTHRPLVQDELFEIRIDNMVEKWSGSIEVGVTMHDPTTIALPGTMTNLGSGTIMMSGCCILTNGKGTRREYGSVNLDDLQVGDRIGLILKNQNNLHYYINGIDQGVAASNITSRVWGVVDLYGRTVKVTIVESDDHESANLILQRRMLCQGRDDDINRLYFHPRCGKYVSVINNGRTVHRPNAREDFNNGVVLTHRPLRKGELFEVRLDRLVSKWAGSIEIGVTVHKPTLLTYPTTMTNVTSGTWMMTGNGVMHNGSTVVDNYGQNLDRLQVGDRVGLLLKENGELNFFVNGDAQGLSLKNMPQNLYGVVDLYGQAAEATIVETDLSNAQSEVSIPEHLKFHCKYGKNIMLSNNGTTALRISPHIEFKEALILTVSELKTNELFCLVVDKLISQWKGSLKIGVTCKAPSLWDLSSTLSDIENGIWFLSGSSTFQDDVKLSSDYSLNLELVEENSVIGMMRLSDGSFHFFHDNIDMGCAFDYVPEDIFVVVDLYGRCCQISIGNPTILFDSREIIDEIDLPEYTFHSNTGSNIKLEFNNVVCSRNDVADLSNALVFSDKPIGDLILFEFFIERLDPLFCPFTLRFGLTTLDPNVSPIPTSIYKIQQQSWFCDGSDVWETKNGKPEKIGRFLRSSVDQFRDRTHVGIKIDQAKAEAHLFINGYYKGIFGEEIPTTVYAVIDVFGSCMKIYIPNPNDDEFPPSDTDSDSSDSQSKVQTNWLNNGMNIYDLGMGNLDFD